MTVSILLVEDKPYWQNILKRKILAALKEIEITNPIIEIFSTFDEADQALNAHPWDLLVTDIGLGDSTWQSQEKLGTHLIEFAREHQIPAIAVSGTPVVDNQDVSDLYIEKNVSAFFSKRPFKSEQFIKKIQEILHKPDSINLEKFMKDVFICHTSEDKQGVVEPLVDAFNKTTISYWYDKAEIKWGDSITKKVNEGLSISRFVLVVLSKAFLLKAFPQKELYSVLNIEIYSEDTKVLPLIVISNDEDKEDIFKKLPLLADKAYLKWNGNPKEIIDALQLLLEEKIRNFIL